MSGHFRVWEDVFRALEAESKAKRISLNTLVNQVLATHTRDEVVLEELRFLRMSRDVYRSYLAMVPDERLSELGALHAKTEDAVLLAMSGSLNLDAVLDELQLLSRSGWYSFHHTRKNGREHIAMSHDLGPRFSVVFSAYLSGMFALAGIHPKVTPTSSSVVVEY